MKCCELLKVDHTYLENAVWSINHFLQKTMWNLRAGVTVIQLIINFVTQFYACSCNSMPLYLPLCPLNKHNFCRWGGMHSRKWRACWAHYVLWLLFKCISPIEYFYQWMCFRHSVWTKCMWNTVYSLVHWILQLPYNIVAYYVMAWMNFGPLFCACKRCSFARDYYILIVYTHVHLLVYLSVVDYCK